MDQRNTDRATNDFVPHLDWLRTVVRARISDPTVVDDVVGEIALEAIRSESQWKHIPKPGPWFYRIAITKIALFRRKQVRATRLLNRVAQDPNTRHVEDSKTVEPYQLLLWAEDVSIVRTALQRLDGKDVEILMLKYVHDWSYSQIETHLGIGMNKIVYRLRKARERLRASIELSNDPYSQNSNNDGERP